MFNLGVAIAGGLHPDSERKRSVLDFYETAEDVTQALLVSQWAPSKDYDVHECAAGDGAIVKVLAAHGYTVWGTDIRSGQNFLDLDRCVAPQIVTNPPFSIAEGFIRKAYELEVSYLALLLKMTYWSAAIRIPLFEECRPAAVLPLTWRMDCTGGGSPTMDFAWYVWRPAFPERLYVKTTAFEPLPRPVRLGGLFEK